MVIAVSNPIGGAIGQLLSPISDPATSVRASPLPLSGAYTHLHPFQVLILGILQSAVAPMVFLIQDKPPKPPSTLIQCSPRPEDSLTLPSLSHSAFAASHDTPSIITLLRVWVGLAPLERDCNRAGRADPYMTWRERMDFVIVVLVFGVLVAA